MSWFTFIYSSCFNTQPPEGGWFPDFGNLVSQISFQHTAARRRLDPMPSICIGNPMFQHTAARRRLVRSAAYFCSIFSSFNTQPPEGGWHGFDVT